MSPLGPQGPRRSGERPAWDGGHVATVLIIDADRQARRRLAQVLTTAGHDYLEAQTGREGIALFDQRLPALIITEIVLPDREGLETIWDLSRDPRRVPIIALSADRVGRGAHHLRLAKAMGADVVMAKPFRGAELVETIERLL